MGSRPLTREKWYRAGLNFTCTQCGNCCSGEPGYVWVTKEEIRRIAEFLGRDDGTLDRGQLRRVGFRYSLTEKPGGDCIFLRRENGTTECEIHPVRPLQCRKWPFWNEVLRSPETWNRTHQKCPGINEGRRYDYAQVEAIRTRRKGEDESDYR